MSGPEAAPAAPDAQSGRSRQARLAAYALFTLGLSAALLLLQRGCAPVGSYSGRVLAGSPSAVSLVDIPRGVYREGTLSEGRYWVELPPFAREPRVSLHGETPHEHWVLSQVLSTGEGELAGPDLALWVTPLDVALREGTVRFDWSPLPTGEGFPQRRSYSILVGYERSDGERGETTFICEEPKRSVPLAELRELLQEWDESKPEVTLELRGYDPGQEGGAIWVGWRQTWRVPELER